jgi:hypothetical protein
MMQTFENQQPSLLELIEEVPRIALAPAQKAQLATLVDPARRDRRDARKGGRQ